MMIVTPTNYESLPTVPHVNAMPGGMPHGPWGPLYKTAPGASLPSQTALYPHYHANMMGGLGQAPPVQIVGAFGAATNGTSTMKKIAGVLVVALSAAGLGALYAVALKSKKKVLYPAIVMGGFSLMGGLATWAAMANSNGAPVVPAG